MNSNLENAIQEAMLELDKQVDHRNAEKTVVKVSELEKSSKVRGNKRRKVR